MGSQESLFEEVRQLYKQYEKEVPTKRRAWPNSIKERVFQLLRLEVSCQEINRQTGMPAATIYSWKARVKMTSGFLPVRVVSNDSHRERIDPVVPKSPTITVVLQDGIRIEGLTANLALEIVRGVRS